MEEEPSPPTAASAASPPSPSQEDGANDELASLPSHSALQSREKAPSYAQNRMSQYSRSSQRSRPQSSATEFPAFSSSLSYAQVRDFAYPDFHPLHFGTEPEASESSTPASESQWNPTRRQSDPLEQWNGNTASYGSGWSAGAWGGDGVMYRDPDDDSKLPSTSFAESGMELEPDEVQWKKSKHRKSRSYADISDFDRGRRRESGRRNLTNEDMFMFQGQQNDPAGRDSLRRSRGYSQGTSGDANGNRRDSRYATTLPNRSFHHSQGLDPDEEIPLDSEPNRHSPIRDSMGPEDEELFAGPSLALYSFEPENSNELRLTEGQEIMVSYRHGQGWLVASDPTNGEQGLVPEAYVRLISDMPNYDPETGQFVDLDEDEDMHDFESSQAMSIPQDSETEGWRKEIQDRQGQAMDEDESPKKLGHRTDEAGLKQEPNGVDEDQ